MTTKQYNNWRFMLTSVCNAECFFCHRDGSGVEKRFLDLQKFKDIINQYKSNIDKIRFTGGEALLHPDVFEMVRITLSVTDNVSIGTNGLLLSKNINQIKALRLPKITVSLHSLDPRTLERITGIDSTSFPDIIESILRLKKFVKIKLNVVILKGYNTSDNELKKILDFVLNNELNIEFIELDLGSIKNIDVAKYHYPPERIVDYINKYAKKHILKFDEAESNWIGLIVNSRIEVHKALCINKLCTHCLNTRPVLVYPDGKMNRCRLSEPLVKGLDIAL